MKLSIGAKLKELRLARDLTQEEVASHLGISFQAISKWERSDGYPDITMLPALAIYFETTVDHLLGMDEITVQSKYNELNLLWKSNNESGHHSENVTLMKNALKDYPNDALLLVQLSTSLEKLDGTPEEKLAYLRESAAVQEQILNYGRHSEIRSAVQFNICFTYMKLGELAKAAEQAKTLPNLYKTRENALAYILEGDARWDNSCSALAPLKWALKLHLGVLCERQDDAEIRKKAEKIIRDLSDFEQMM